MEQEPPTNRSADREAAANHRTRARPAAPMGKGAGLGAQDHPWMMEQLESGKFKHTYGDRAYWAQTRQRLPLTSPKSPAGKAPPGLWGTKALPR
ncbi:hypothetical protein FKM82_020090 [Ascaphus truei]